MDKENLEPIDFDVTYDELKNQLLDSFNKFRESLIKSRDDIAERIRQLEMDQVNIKKLK